MLGEEFGDLGVELFAAANAIESGEQVGGVEPGFVVAGVLAHDSPLVHHDNAVGEVDGLLHGMGDHEGGEFFLLNNFPGKLSDLVGAFGIEGGGMFIEEEQAGADPYRHEESQRLALAAGEGADGIVDPVFEAHI